MRTLIRARGLIDGTGSGFRAGAGLLIEGERLLAVAAADDLQGRAERVLDLGDAVLLPGFVDAHTHITIRPGEGDQHGQLARHPVAQALRGVANVREMLRSGVTTARIMGERDGIDFEFRSAIAAGELPGPRLLVSGSALSASHGHGVALGVADGPGEIRRAVRANLRLGADHIKIFVTGGVSSSGSDPYAHHYSREEIALAVAEAHRAGRTVAAHAHGGPGVDLCIEEGVDSIEHGALLTDGNIERLAASGCWLVLTTSIAFHPDGIERGDAHDPGILAKVARVRETMEATFERIRGAGVRFALGTDSMHGLFGSEIEWPVRRGLDPEQALLAATRNGAEVLGLADEIGTLETGKRADVVALAGDPLQDIGAVQRVAAVISGGRLRVRDGHLVEGSDGG